MQRGDGQPSGDCTDKEVVSLTWHLQGHKMSVIVSTQALTNVLSDGQNLAGTEKRTLGTWELQMRMVIQAGSQRGGEKRPV